MPISGKPPGRILPPGRGDTLFRVNFQEGAGPLEIPEAWNHSPECFAEAVRQLSAYFAGRLFSFDLDVAPDGTEFQRAVSAELEKIPYGETATYGETARRLGRPGAGRAVGAANGRNPLPIVIPRHRVVGANGRLTGCGGGLWIKEWLLNMEIGAFANRTGNPP
ncbi:MAG: methylated-DNA--[protein]-cysteine S-methyltransferase [Desulfococcaceae bacterium]